MEERVLFIVNYIRGQRGLEKLIRLSSDMSLTEDLDLESLDLAQLTVMIEDEFGVDIFENKIIKTVGEIYECIGK